MRAGLTEEQLAMRRTGIGSSEIAVVAGLSRWSSPAEIWETKVRGYTREQTFVMRYGHVMEEPIAQLYSEDTGRAHLSHPGTVRSAEHSIVLATPDRAVHLVPHVGDVTQDWETVDRLLEIKAPGWQMRGAWRDPARDPHGIPQEVYAQVTWEMGATGARLCDVAAMVERDPLRIYTIPFDREYFGLLLELGNRFWRDHVVTKKPPPPDASDSYSEFLKRAFPAPKEQGELLPSNPGIEAAATALEAVDGDLKRLEKESKHLQNVLKEFIGDASGILLADGGKITWNKTKGGVRTDWEQIAMDLLARVSTLYHRDSQDTPSLSPEQWKLMCAEMYRDIVVEHTRATDGHRRLWKPWSRSNDE